jgi:hypothetical protein
MGCGAAGRWIVARPAQTNSYRQKETAMHHARFVAATRTVILVLLALFMAAPLWAEVVDDDEKYLTEDDETNLAMQTQTRWPT